jgi:hypothetical protein
MGKLVADAVLDGALDIIKNNCTRQTVCSSQPTTYTEGNATYALADVTMSSSDFTHANGDTSGRKTTIAAKTGVTVDVTGTVTHAALLDVSGTALQYVTTTASQAVGAGGTVDIGTWKIEIADPS